MAGIPVMQQAAVGTNKSGVAWDSKFCGLASPELIAMSDMFSEETRWIAGVDSLSHCKIIPVAYALHIFKYS